MPHQCTNCGRTFADGSKEMLSGCPDCGGNKFQFAPTATAATESFDGAGDSSSADATASADSDTGSEGVTARAAETVRDWVSSDSTPSSDETDSTTSATSPDSDRSWPASGRADETESDASADEGFAEWPETARRPADRVGTAGRTDPDEAVDADGSRRQADGPTTTLADDENTAQADARSEVVPTDDLPSQADGFEPAETASDTDVDGTADAPGATGNDDAPPEHGRVVKEPSGERPSIEELREELNEQFESIKIVRPGQYELNLMELYNRDEYIISLQEDGRYVIDVPDSWRDGDADE